MAEQPRPLRDLQTSGLLWLINRVVFHPRGFSLALAVRESDGEVIGWNLLGDGTTARLMYGPEPEFHAAEATFAAVRHVPAAHDG